MKPTIRWVVALKPEANPLIERFGLRHVRESPDLFPVYRSVDGKNELVISGPGKVSSAAATSFLAANGDADSVAGWINFGIAGGGNGDYGKAFLAAKVKDRSTGLSWYPPSVVDRKSMLPRIGVETIDRPSEEYCDDGTLFEMEASGFYPVALRATTAEICQVIKIVSDDSTHPMKEVSKSQVEELCSVALQQLDPWLDGFREIVAEEASRTADPSGFEEWTSRLRFSETQSHRLRRLLRQWQSLSGECEIAPRFTTAETCSAQTMLDALETKIRGMTTTDL